MPVDNTKVISPRRTTKKLTEEEIKDIEQKRLRGELACAECRRLKLRCDKNVPCGSCFRRGCESICPLGILTGGQGTRFILADTEQLHEKIYEMSNRIRQLEDALAILQSSVSDQRHPLLSDELLKVKFGSESINTRETPTSDEDHAPQKSIDALGTLSLGSSGKLQYLGRSAGSETLMMKADDEGEDSSDENQDTDPTPLDMFEEVQRVAELFPFTSRNRPNLNKLELLETYLPSMDEALDLCNCYIDHATFFFRPIKRDELFDTLLPAVYNAAAGRRAVRLDVGSSPSSDIEEGHSSMKRSAPHALASLYFIFSLGALLDLERLPFNSDAERFCDLGRAGLSLRSVYESANMDTVQAMGLMATYHTLAGKKYSRDSAWSIMSFTAKVAQSIGLHRDSARWNMDPITVQKRRNLFWEVFSADVSHSLALGRPPAIHLSYVDCEFPVDDDASFSEDSKHQMGFWRMKHHFAKDIYNSVAEITLIAHAPSYNTILDLDKKVREIYFPPSFNPFVKLKDVGPEIFNSSSLCLRDFYASQHRTVTMIYLHRSFFAQAMLDHPINPLLSPFAPSFLTAYHCATIIIKASAHLFERCGEMAMRLWFLMYHTFSAAVIVGTVITRSPNSDIASMMKDFKLAISLFERTAPHSHHARVALGILLKLRENATRTHAQHSSNVSPVSPTLGTTIDIFATDDIEDDLAIFGGTTRVLGRKGKQVQAQPQLQTAPSNFQSNPLPKSPFSYGHRQPTSHQGSPSGSSPGSSSVELDNPQVHPSLINYLKREPEMTPGPQNVTPLVGGDGINFFLTQPESQTSTRLTPQSTNLVDRREYELEYGGGGMMSQSMAGLSSNPALGSERYLNTSQIHQRPAPHGYHNAPLSNTNVLGDYPRYGYGNPSSDNTHHMPVNIGNVPMGGRTAEVDTGYVPTYTFRTSDEMNAMDSAGAVGLFSGMDTGWLTFMRDCGIMDVREDR